MSSYGVTPTGFNRKPLAVTLAELQAAFETEYGSEVIQTPQSPLGQINGLMADMITRLWEEGEDIYQSYDPDQAEGIRLDILGRLRLIYRNGSTDTAFRQMITNVGQGRVDVQDLAQAITSIPGVTYARVFINETGEVSFDGLERGTVAIAVIGGEDSVIADTMRRFIAPGVSTYGNERVTTNVAGFCRSMSIIRPVEVDVELDIVVRRNTDQQNCPAPSTLAIAEFLDATWAIERANGTDPSFYSIRAIIERQFTNVEVISVTGSRDGQETVTNQPIPIGFMEIARINSQVTSA